MNNYIVSARKYRPVTFDTVVGQGSLTATLKNSITSGHLAHAYLFCGPRGVGKTTCARIFAKTINCATPLPNGEACGECESCRAFNEQRSLNIHELDAASNNGVEDIRALIEQTRIPPQVGKYKVFIVDEVHMLSSGAFNAFLKTLEEPPHYVIFILATTEKHKLLPTILSRCQIYDFKRMSVQDIVGHLQNVAQKEGVTAEPAALNVIAEKADGGMRDALSIFDQVTAFCGGNITYQQTIANLNVLDYDYYFKLVDYFLACDIPSIMLTFNAVINKGFDGSHFINGLNSHLRNLLMCRDAKTTTLLDTDDTVRQRYAEQAARCKPQFLYAAIRKCTDCDINYKMSQNKRLLVEITLIEVAQLTQEDVPSSGRSPKKILKPIFNKVTTGTTAAVAPAAVKPAAAPQRPAVAPQSAPLPQPIAIPQPFVAPQSAPISIPQPFVAQQPTAIPRPATVVQPVPSQQPVPSTPLVQPSAPASSAPALELSYANLCLAIRTYAQQLPDKDVALKARLSAVEPRLTDTNTFTIEAVNPSVEAEFQRVAPSLLAFLRQHFRNPSLNCNVLYSPAEHVRTLTKSEMLTELVKNNPGIRNLVKELQLSF